MSMRLLHHTGTEKGTFYLDPYCRLREKYGGAWIEHGRENSAFHEGKPISFLNLNLNPTVGKQPALMSMKDVLLLFSMVRMMGMFCWS